MNFNYDDYYRPCHDVVFAIMFADKALFVRLCSAVYDQMITIAGEPHSQAVVRENDVLLKPIRFDILAVADTNQIFTLDMQRRYTKGRQERRCTYYMCRTVSSQNVVDMKYEELHPVHIAFILTSHPKVPNAIRKVGLCFLDTGDIYDDLIELVLVYVPEVIKETGPSKDNDLYIFSRFFAVSSQDEAVAYAAEFEANDLAKELIHMYNSIVSNPQNLQTVENSPYFIQRLNETQLAEARAEAEAKGKAIGEAKGKAIGEAKGEAKGKAIGEAKGEAKGIVKGANQLAKLIKEGYDLETALKMIEG